MVTDTNSLRWRITEEITAKWIQPQVASTRGEVHMFPVQFHWAAVAAAQEESHHPRLMDCHAEDDPTGDCHQTQRTALARRGEAEDLLIPIMNEWRYEEIISFLQWHSHGPGGDHGRTDERKVKGEDSREGNKPAESIFVTLIDREVQRDHLKWRGWICL